MVYSTSNSLCSSLLSHLLVIGCKLSSVSVKREYNVSKETFRTPCIAVVLDIVLDGKNFLDKQCVTVNLNS